MTIALQQADFESKLGQKLLEEGHTVVLDDNNIDPARKRSLLIIDPMPGAKMQNSINANIIALTESTDTVLCPTIWNIDVTSNKNVASIDVSEAKFEEIKQGDFDMVVAAGASADHVEYEQFKGLDKLRQVFRWASEETGGLLTICWSSMVALDEFHGVEKRVERSEAGMHKIIGHFDHKTTQTASHHQDSQYAEYRVALNQISTLPLGCVGYLPDEPLFELEETGAISILSLTPEKTGIVDRSSIAVIMDNHHPIAYWGPHPDYKLEYVLAEIERDLGPDKQPGVVVEKDKVIGQNRSEPEHDWREGASAFFQTFMEEAHARREASRTVIRLPVMLSGHEKPTAEHTGLENLGASMC